MSDFVEERREKRLLSKEADFEELSTNTYNTIMGGVIAYGLIINIILCYYCGDWMEQINPLAFIIGYFVLCISGIVISSRSKDPYISFLGYNLVVVPVGVVVSDAVSVYGGLDSEIVLQAFVYTAIITGCMIVLSIVSPKFFAGLGGILFSCLVGLVLAELVSLMLGFNTYIYSWIGAIVFSLYIGYDMYRSQEFAKTADNAVDSALDIYLDIVNLFLRLLRIMGNSKSSSRR